MRFFKIKKKIHFLGVFFKSTDIALLGIPKMNGVCNKYLKKNGFTYHRLKSFVLLSRNDKERERRCLCTRLSLTPPPPTRWLFSCDPMHDHIFCLQNIKSRYFLISIYQTNPENETLMVF